MKSTNPWANYAYDRCINRNKNFIAVFLGSTGSGKTYASLDFALGVAQKCGTTFTIKENVAFTFGEMLKKMELPQNQKAGTVFLIEEVGSVGSGASSNEWQSKANAFFSSFMQTSRHRNQVLLMTTPNFSLLMKQGRELIHAQIIMEEVNKHNKTSIGRVKMVQVNPSNGKVYLKYLRVLDEDGSPIRAETALFHLPPEDVLKEYEETKLKFTTALNKMIMAKLNGDDKPKGKHGAIDEVKFNEFVSKGVKQRDIAKYFNVSQQAVSQKMSALNMETTL
jgi:hypothetical protein